MMQLWEFQVLEKGVTSSTMSHTLLMVNISSTIRTELQGTTLTNASHPEVCDTGVTRT